MPTPSSGQISLSDIAYLVYKNRTYQTSFGNYEVKSVMNNGVDNISLSAAYNKPVPGNSGTTYYVGGNYSFLVPPYEVLSVILAGAGGSGGSYCGGQVFIGCVNYCCSGAGNPGGDSYFNGIYAYGGGGGASAGGAAGAPGGNNINGNKGGGGAKGLGNTNPADTNCNQAAGADGGDGGYITYDWTKAVTPGNPDFNTVINFTVGSPGAPAGTSCRDQRGGQGASGYVYMSWSS